jgi:hypothetical protein
MANWHRLKGYPGRAGKVKAGIAANCLIRYMIRALSVIELALGHACEHEGDYNGTSVAKKLRDAAKELWQCFRLRIRSVACLVALNFYQAGLVLYCHYGVSTPSLFSLEPRCVHNEHQYVLD